jgi:predicted nuclease with RNAse H fold
MEECIVGFDPGGKRSFGWCIAKFDKKVPLDILKTGCCDHAQQAIGMVKEYCEEKKYHVLAAGVDAPLTWPKERNRKIDEFLKNHVDGEFKSSIMHVNSLQGACLIQGIKIAKLLNEQFEGIQISESHPAVIRALLSIAKDKQKEHEKDAALCCLSAWAMKVQDSLWRNYNDIARGDDENIYPNI